MAVGPEEPERLADGFRYQPNSKENKNTEHPLARNTATKDTEAGGK